MAVISEIKKRSKNLFNPNNWVGGTITEFNGIPCLSIIDGAISYYDVVGKPNEQFKLTFKLYRSVGNETKKTNLKTSERNVLLNIVPDTKYTVAVYGGERLYFDGWNTTLYIDLSITQLEKGETATDFEPYYLNVTKYNNETIKNIKFNGVDYHFAKKSDAVNGTCENSVNEPIVDMQIQGNSKQVLLPLEYQEVEHLQNSGTQRIDVGLVPTNSTSITIIYQSLVVAGQSQYILGSREHASAVIAYALNGSSSTNIWDVRLNGVVNAMGTRTTDWYKSELTLNNGSGTWKLTNLTTGEVNSMELSGQNVNATANLFLFAYNNIDANTHKNLRIKYFEWKEAGELKRKYIPCYRKSDNEAGLYDLVTKELYTNAGTGSFIVGADYESKPSLDQPCEIVSVGGRTKNLVNIPIIDSSTGTKTIRCYIDQTISFSCQEYPTLIARDDGTETSIWRIAFKRLDGSTTYAVDSALKGQGTTLTTVTADNPIVSIEYRGTYIREGAYKGIQIEYGREITAYEPYGYKIPINTYIGNLANENTI